MEYGDRVQPYQWAIYCKQQAVTSTQNNCSLHQFVRN